MMMMAAAATVLAACGNEDESDDWAGEIRLSSGLAVQKAESRSIAAELQAEQIASGVNVGFFINEAVNENPATTYTQNLSYTATGSGNFDGTTVYYPQSGNGVNIYAYAPYAAGLALDGNYSFTVKENQSTDADYLASDLLWGQPMKLKENSTDEYVTANPVARTKENVSVTFKHLLSKVQVTLKPGNGLTADDFKGATLSILQVLPTTSLILNSGVISRASGEETNITAATYPTDATPTLTASAIVVPQTITRGTQFMKVHLNAGGDLYYTIPTDQDLTLESGKIYKYEITVNLTGLTVTSSIIEWETIGEGNPVQGIATME